MFGTQSMRLLRENWQSATMLAEELYAMFQNTVPLETQAPLTIGPMPGTETPLVINTGDGGTTYMTFGNKTKGVQGSIQFNDLAGGPWMYDKNGKPVGDPAGKGKSSTTTGGQTDFLIVIVSGGPGASYQCNVYPNGTGAPPLKNGDGTSKLFNCQAVQLAADAQVPAGTTWPAWLLGGIYWFQPPIFIGSVT